MAQDYGILITQPGTDVSGAPVNQVSLNTSKPFIKIDTQNSEGFKSVTLIITTDPPEPVFPATNTYTTLYKFKHGYKYTPSVETLFYITNKPPTAVVSQQYFQDSGTISARTSDDGASLYVCADATWVYVVCAKYNNGGLTNLLTGTNVDITFHVFVEDIGA